MNAAILMVVLSLSFEFPYGVIASSNQTEDVAGGSTNNKNSKSSSETDDKVSTSLPPNNKPTSSSLGPNVKSTVTPTSADIKNVTGAPTVQNVSGSGEEKKNVKMNFEQKNAIFMDDYDYHNSYIPIEPSQSKPTGCFLDQHDLDELFEKVIRRGYKYNSADELYFRSASQDRPILKDNSADELSLLSASQDRPILKDNSADELSLLSASQDRPTPEDHSADELSLRSASQDRPTLEDHSADELSFRSASQFRPLVRPIDPQELSLPISSYDEGRRDIGSVNYDYFDKGAIDF